MRATQSLPLIHIRALLPPPHQSRELSILLLSLHTHHRSRATQTLRFQIIALYDHATQMLPHKHHKASRPPSKQVQFSSISLLPLQSHHRTCKTNAVSYKSPHSTPARHKSCHLNFSEHYSLPLTKSRWLRFRCSGFTFVDSRAIRTPPFQITAIYGRATQKQQHKHHRALQRPSHQAQVALIHLLSLLNHRRTRNTNGTFQITALYTRATQMLLYMHLRDLLHTSFQAQVISISCTRFTLIDARATKTLPHTEPLILRTRYTNAAI